MTIRRPASAPAWFTLLYGLVGAAISSYTMYDPADTQKMLAIADSASARCIGEFSS
jgi:hypothetical protein